MISIRHTSHFAHVQCFALSYNMKMKVKWKYNLNVIALWFRCLIYMHSIPCSRIRIRLRWRCTIWTTRNDAHRLPTIRRQKFSTENISWHRFSPPQLQCTKMNWEKLCRHFYRRDMRYFFFLLCPSVRASAHNLTYSVFPLSSIYFGTLANAANCMKLDRRHHKNHLLFSIFIFKFTDFDARSANGI